MVDTELQALHDFLLKKYTFAFYLLAFFWDSNHVPKTPPETNGQTKSDVAVERMRRLWPIVTDQNGLIMSVSKRQ